MVNAHNEYHSATKHIHMLNLTGITLGKKCQEENIGTLQFHLYEVLETVKLIFDANKSG